MSSDLNTLQRAYDLVHFLHRNPDVVEDIIGEALLWLPQIRFRQRKRPEVEGDYKPVRPRFEELSEVFFQLSLFETSERWEKREELRAAPKPSMLLGRYIKHCVWQGLIFMDSRYTAFGLGCLLYHYTSEQICKVFCLDPGHHRDRVIRAMKKRLVDRFKHIVSQCPQALSSVISPTDGERQLIDQALTLFAPWGTACPSPVELPPALDLLPEESEALPHHILIHPACAGIAQSVRAWNGQQSERPWNRREKLLLDPDTVLKVPMFTNDRDGNDVDDASSRELSDQELEKLKDRIVDCLPSTLGRRRKPHFLAFRVCVDGEEWEQFTPEARALSLTVPISAMRLQIFGHDTEGELPLALFYLPDFIEEATPQRLYAVLEGGATFEVVVTPVVEQDDTIEAGRVDLQFWAEEAQVLKTPAWYEAAVTAAGLSVEVARLAGDQHTEAVLLARLGDLCQAQDQTADARAYWQASVTLARRIGDKELEAILDAQLAEVNKGQKLFDRLMETIKIRVEGFAFEEFASLLAQRLKDAGVSIQVSPSSERLGSFAHDPATIIVQGPEVFAEVLNALAAILASKTGSRSTGTIEISGPRGYKESVKLQDDMERIAERARENGADQMILRTSERRWP